MPLLWSKAPSRTTDDHACAALIKQGSKSFYAASLLLPEHVRVPAYAIYAFCRLSDDAVDDAGAEKDAIARLREKLDRAYRGEPGAHPAERAFAATIARTNMPRALPEALIDGLAFDAEGRRCETLADLYAYAARVAAAVGAMMTVLMGVRDPVILARACDLGIAMQFTNIARDVGEDARNGRVYLPQVWLEEMGIDRQRLLENPCFDERIGRLTRRLLALAEELYDRASGGIAGLPRDCRAAMHAARIIYREIGRDVARRGYNSVDQRAVVSKKRKFWLLAAASARARLPVGLSDAPTHAESMFLVEAVPPLPLRLAKEGPLDQRVGWILDLFDRLNERDKLLRAGELNQGVPR
jgi:15-cis-phytoene synthase